MTRQQEAFDYRRHTFSVMSAESRASMRRRSFDFTAQFGHTYPPTSSSLPLSHSLNAHQHLRVYGKSTSPAKRLSECHEKGAPFVALVAPHSVTVWTRGKPVMIEWKVLDTKVEKLCIELLEDGLNATTLIAKEAPNSGFFTYPKVPWGMESGSKYFLRISASEDRERYCTSSFFQISSAP
ncbi:Ser-Thr-rich glycosyl-phosphatidyl-inositol-anchored membrane family [Plasmopara halstedii]|uniref:Ser-Thr-rich glycosyl-phosphatidyl-inositol-anchored membrane family n=1 Tax=Plasmopara halstedii TaxID=4781 RepID=A0A0P1AC89_PLAHL|nr:Ser-Thr-rich glycosyl-phosphatidyl-inositol-anchored membrane family [Plasmopara halstedii]CEG38154.1 Ser-Thr-rich glycosyl-phosphatidyl-inositol-anchored membrane family [Plasmopara halstedii]|eukprot:XP_024574523.1 Ser-Thr-rich glycosyl-phosphatidyl-inositol-anchored membrane family [Plasmopara halstedii]